MTFKKFAMSAAFCGLAIGLALPAAAQYRENTPPVIEAKPKAAPRNPADGIQSEFYRLYTARQSPKMVVLWNRTFSDEVGTQYENAQVTTARKDTGAREVLSMNTKEVSGFEESRQEVVSGVRRVDPAKRAGFAQESVEWALEGPFMQVLVENGVQLVDRAVAMRSLNGGQSMGATPDVQAVEMQAMLAKADLMLEVLMSPSASAVSGMLFRITITDVKSGQTMTRVVTEAMPWQEPPVTRTVATQNGFERVTNEPEPVTVEMVGEALALDVMKALVNIWI